MLIRLKQGTGRTVLIEVAEGELVGVGHVNEVLELLDTAMDKILHDEIVENCRVIAGAISEVAKSAPAPNKFTAELGFQFTAEGSIYIVKSAAAASIKLTIEWSI